jgi:hypothetical protein
MDPGNSFPNLEKRSAPSGAVSHAVVRAALVVSIFAFLPPLALAAVVMGHLAEKRGVATRGMAGRWRARRSGSLTFSC